MTLAVGSRADYVGNGATSTYSFGFLIRSNTDLRVTVADTSGVETQLALTTDYTVTGMGLDAGGSISLVNASQAWLTSGALKSGYALTIRRVRPHTQTTSTKNQARYNPELHEDSFDNLAMKLQQLQDEVDRATKLPETEYSSDTTFTGAADRAGKFMYFDTDGRPAVAASVTGAAVSSFAETLLDDPDAAAARTTLGISATNTPFTPVGSIAATDTQSAVAEVATDAASALATHEADTTSIHGITDTAALATKSGAETLSNKTLSDALTMTEIAAPSAPASGKVAIYPKSDHKLYLKGSDGTESAIGSGGQGGVNFLTLDTSFLPNKITNSDLESSVGDWAAYADAAASSPVDMTGGSPTTTATRSTTSPLDGAAHLLLTKDAANRQGEGVSCVANIPPGYRTSRIYYEFPYKVTSGTYALDDTQVFVYDVTNSQLITPFRQSKIYGTQGVAFGYFDIQSTTAQIRFGLHVASTSASAYTLAIDDVKVTPVARSFSVPASDWQNYTPTFTGFGTVATSSFWYRRVGDSIQIQGKFTSGTPTATEARISFPSGITADSTKVPAIRHVGTMMRGTLSTDNERSVLVESGVTYVTLGVINSASYSAIAKRLGTELLQNGDEATVEATVPISGWSSNVQMADSASFKISSYLANGTRVTGSAPTALGQYRSYLRNASATTFTETNGSPTASPNTSDGIRIYQGNAWGSADTNNSPTKYEIFVGKNKQVKFEWYANTGRTGFVSTTPFLSGTSDIGYHTHYDPSTGIVTVCAEFVAGGSRTAHISGYGADGNTGIASPYFDITVSENALSVGAESCRSECLLYTGNGKGSTNTAIRNFTNSATTGTAFTPSVNDSVNGSKVTINEDGIYAMTYSDRSNAGNCTLGISKNSTNLTTDIFGLSASTGEKLAVVTTGGASFQNNASVTRFLRAGDVIRAHVNPGAAPNETTDSAFFSITKVNL